MKKALIGLAKSELPLEGYRKKQLQNWIYVSCARSFDEMTNLPKDMKAELEQNWQISPFKSVEEFKSADGSEKFLFTLEDGLKTEAVYMPYEDHITMCISSMVGCPIGCKFCSTGTMGFKRNLTSGEILDQIVYASVLKKHLPQKIRNVVFMGMGEPLLNFENVMNAIKIMVDKDCLDMSQRRITVSTVGIPKGIRDLADQGLEIKLALSLHAPDDETRKKIIPTANIFTIKEIMDSVRYFFGKTKRRISFEYVMLAGINDSLSQARALLKYTHGIVGHFNLIPFNPWEGSPFKSSSKEQIEKFALILGKGGVDVSIRWSRGQDIGAACGQLANKS